MPPSAPIIKSWEERGGTLRICQFNIHVTNPCGSTQEYTALDFLADIEV